VDELLVYLAPSLIGDSGRGMFHLRLLTELSRSKALKIRECRSAWARTFVSCART